MKWKNKDFNIRYRKASMLSYCVASECWCGFWLIWQPHYHHPWESKKLKWNDAKRDYLEDQIRGGNKIYMEKNNNIITPSTRLIVVILLIAAGTIPKGWKRP